jgi:hypothetical protein
VIDFFDQPNEIFDLLRCSAVRTRTVHPPAASNPVIVFLAHSGWGFLLFPVVMGAPGAGVDWLALQQRGPQNPVSALLVAASLRALHRWFSHHPVTALWS